MWRAIKLVLYLVVLGGIGLLGLVYIGPFLGFTLEPTQTIVTVPVELGSEN